MKCRYCGAKIEDDSIFCRFCGERVARQRRKAAGEAREIRVPRPHQLASGEYAAQVMINGRRETVKGWTEAEYYEKARALKAGLLAVKERHDKMTLTAAIDKYIASRSMELSPATIRGYRVIQRNRYPELMKMDVWEITEDVLTREVAKAKKKIQAPKPRIQNNGEWGAVVTGKDGRREMITAKSPEEYWQKAALFKVGEDGLRPAAKTIKNDTGLVKAVIRYVTKRRLTISTPKVIIREHPFLEPEQITVFCEAVKGRPVEIPALLALSSLRVSELVHLTWDKIDLKKRLILVEGADVYDENNKLVSKDDNKNETSRRVVPIMMDQLFNALQAAKKDGGRVVDTIPGVVYRRVNRVCKTNDLPLVGVHGLRHSFASLAAHLQMPVAIAQEIGGWKDDEIMMRIYTHVAQTDKERYKNEMSAFYNRQNKTDDG